MADLKYSWKTEQPHAKAYGKALRISTKVAVEIAAYLRGRYVVDAKRILNDVIAHREAIPYKRFNMDVGHKPGTIAAGRYPEKASKEILGLLESAERNAIEIGLAENSLVLQHINAHKAFNGRHGGRRAGRAMKMTHVEIIVVETVPKVKKTRKKAPAKKKSAPQQEKQKQQPAEKETTKETTKEKQRKEKTEEKKEEKKELSQSQEAPQKEHKKIPQGDKA